MLFSFSLHCFKIFVGFKNVFKVTKFRRFKSDNKNTEGEERHPENYMNEEIN